MSTPLEHDYIGLANNPSMDKTSSSLNFKETELRLGLPGCESPDRKSVGGGISFFANKDLKNLVASVGAKRGFSDAIDESSKKWSFSMNDGSDGTAGLETQTNIQKINTNATKNIKEVLHQSVHEKNKQVNGTNEHANAPASKYVSLHHSAYCF